MDAETVHDTADLGRHLDKVALVGHDVHGGNALGLGKGPDVKLCERKGKLARRRARRRKTDSP